MKRFFLPAALGILVLAFVSLLYAADVLSVQVEKTEVRTAPKFWAGAVATLAYGDRVTPTKQEGDWYEVTVNGKTGWIHKTAVTSRQVTLASGGSTVSTATSTNEVSLAGKGFNESVEKNYAATRDVDFSQVDAMSRLTVSDAELKTFLEQGKLAEWGTTP